MWFELGWSRSNMSTCRHLKPSITSVAALSPRTVRRDWGHLLQRRMLQRTRAAAMHVLPHLACLAEAQQDACVTELLCFPQSSGFARGAGRLFGEHTRWVDRAALGRGGVL